MQLIASGVFLEVPYRLLRRLFGNCWLVGLPLLPLYLKSIVTDGNG